MATQTAQQADECISICLVCKICQNIVSASLLIYKSLHIPISPSLQSSVTFSLQALAMGMMTEYYHYIFTTLVSRNVWLFRTVGLSSGLPQSSVSLCLPRFVACPKMKQRCSSIFIFWFVHYIYFLFPPLMGYQAPKKIIALYKWYDNFSPSSFFSAFGLVFFLLLSPTPAMSQSCFLIPLLFRFVQIIYLSLIFCLPSNFSLQHRCFKRGWYFHIESNSLPIWTTDQLWYWN